MKTIHLANSNPHSTEFQTVLARMCDEAFPYDTKRFISCGAGIVILPETDKKHDCSPSELAKALHLKEEMEKSSTAKTTAYLAYNFETEENHFIALTNEQIRLLDWLARNNFIREDDIFSKIDSGLETI